MEAPGQDVSLDDMLVAMGSQTAMGMVFQIGMEADVDDLQNLCQVNTRFRNLCQNPDFWVAKFYREYGFSPREIYQPRDELRGYKKLVLGQADNFVISFENCHVRVDRQDADVARRRAGGICPALLLLVQYGFLVNHDHVAVNGGGLDNVDHYDRTGPPLSYRLLLFLVRDMINVGGRIIVY